MNKDVKINWDLLKKVMSNEGNCLCKINVNCPCSEFVNNEKCDCGVFKIIKK